MRRKMMTEKKLSIKNLAICASVLLIAGAAPATLQAQCEEGRLRTRLTGGAIGGMEPSGHADFLALPGMLRFSAEVEDVNLPEGTPLRVFVDDAEIGSIVLGPAPVRGGDLNRDTRDGDVAPSLNQGSVVRIVGPGGAILAGVLQKKCAGDTRDRREDVMTPPPACTAAQPGAETRVRTRLTGGVLGGLQPSGHADFRLRNGQMRFSTEVEDINLPPNTQLQVLVGGNPVGTITVGAGLVRGGDLNLDTRNGHAVPNIAGPTPVSVVGPNGVLLSGVLQPGSVCVAGGNSQVDSASPNSSRDDRIRQRTSLTGGRLNGLTPSGHADYRVFPSRNRLHLSVEVEDVNLPAGTVLEVFVEGEKVGTMRVGPAPIRGAELELNTNDGQAVPRLASGSATVTVVAPGGVPILSGVLRTLSFDDSPSSRPDDRSMSGDRGRGRGSDDRPGDDRGGDRSSGGGGSDDGPGDDRGGSSGKG